MPYRKIVLGNNEFYHVYNRGVEKRTIFNNKFDYRRFINTLNYYQFGDNKLRYSHFLSLKVQDQLKALRELNQNFKKLVEIHCFCLMPNHIHLLLKQVTDGGISTFMRKATNSYSHFYNTKNERVGPLFQGNFGAVRIENSEQLIHVGRYIHLNPVTSFLIKPEELSNYQFSSYPEYLNLKKGFSQTSETLSNFKDIESYTSFTLDQVEYSRKLHLIKHLTLED